ncbi:heavy metal translocating P-type ATPase [Eubacterium ventriosum]|uniref:heavy metal translocating P-type ATPase n=1 Tax=Eubacterium ventriosum TaxID=39496 RepID=UPI00352151D1
MKKYTISGMSCAACQSRVEKAVNALPDVDSAVVSLLTNSMQVEGSASDSEIIQTVEKAGYGAKTAGGSKKDTASMEEDQLKDTQTPILRKRLIVSLVLLIPLMYISMGHLMWDWPLPSFLIDNHIAMGLIQMLFTIAILVINQKFFISGFKGVLNKAPNMDTLVAMGAGAAFAYSTYVLFAMTDAQVSGNSDKVMEYMHDFYFESAAMIVTLITLGKMLESYSKGKTTDALKSLMKMVPKTATIIEKDLTGNEKEKIVSIEDININDVFVVKPGENIPVDGIVIDGFGAVDESAITGESIPVDKTIGSKVSSAGVNQSGYLKCKATRVGEDTTLAQIIQMVSDASATKAPIAKVADKVSGIFVPVVICIALVTIFAWLIAGETVGFALARGISVLVISCPCALGLATPVAIMVGNGVGAKKGILFKNATSLETTGKTQIVALDKTGTITVGKPKVTAIITEKETDEKELFGIAIGLESKSEHPLAKAITGYAKENNIKPYEIVNFKSEVGNGLVGEYNGSKVFTGNRKFIEKNCNISTNLINKTEKLSEKGMTPLFFARDNKVLGIIAVADVIKEDSREAILELENMGIKVIMLTGDNEKTAKAIGHKAGVDQVIAGVLPQGKESTIRELTEYGNTVMVGDGINDAPALTRANIGMAIGAGTDVAIDAADVVLMKSNLKDVPAAIRLSKAVLRNIHENLFWAFIYNIIGIPLAAGIWYPIFGWKLNPMFGAAAMSLSSFCVVTNALRLNLVNIYNNKKDRKIKNSITEVIGNNDLSNNIDNKESEKETNTMEKTMKITGMMCGHCEATVKKALEALEQVDEAIVSHEEGTAVVKLNSDISNDVLKKTVEDKDYTVNDIIG